MCNLNFAVNKTGQPAYALTAALEVMGWLSSEINKDGSGMLARDLGGQVIFARSEGLVRIPSGGYDTIALHHRISTSGYNSENLHPHRRAGFMMMHNGIFNELGDKATSDTAKYCDMLQDELNKSGDIVAAIQAVHKSVSGYYSILLYDRKHDRFLYYKNSRASMYGLEHPKYRICSTRKENIEFAKWYLRLDPAKVTPLEFKDCVIYDLHNLQELGRIEDKPYTPKFIAEDKDYSRYYSYTEDATGKVKKGYKSLGDFMPRKGDKSAKALKAAERDDARTESIIKHAFKDGFWGSYGWD